jgi:replicative DNA helicase
MSETRTPPHEPIAEKIVLSGFTKAPWMIAETGLPEAAFHLPAHRAIYRQLVDEDEEVSIEALLAKLNGKGLLGPDKIVSPAVLADVCHGGTRDYERMVRLVRNRFARRMAIAAAEAAIESAFDCSEGDDSGNYLEALGGPITEVFDAASGIEADQDTDSLANEFLNELENKIAGKVTPMGLPTGIPEIDQALLGLHEGHMGIISGSPGGGKSTLATQISVNLMDDGHSVLYLAYERGRQSVFRRSMIQASRTKAASINDPKAHPLTKYNLIHIREAVEKAKRSLHVRLPKNRKARTCLAEIRRYHRKHGVKVVIVDQIGLLRGDRQRTGTAEEELRLISNSIQELAQELQITIIVLCQVTVDGDTKNARAIEEDADWWLSIIQERDKKKKNFGEHQHVLVAKDSHNSRGGERLPLILDKESLRFVHGTPATPEQEKKTRY